MYSSMLGGVHRFWLWILALSSFCGLGHLGIAWLELVISVAQAP